MLRVECKVGAKEKSIGELGLFEWMTSMVCILILNKLTCTSVDGVVGCGGGSV